jgi:ferredoxin
MLVMYLCVMVIDVGHVLLRDGIDVDHVFVCEGYRCLSYICVLGVPMLVMYLYVRSIDVGHAFVCEGYQCLSCICVLWV